MKPLSNYDYFNEYRNTFSQQVSRYSPIQKKALAYQYAMKLPDVYKNDNGTLYLIKKNDWRTVKLPLPDRMLESHLRGKIFIAVIGRWYPAFALHDFDKHHLLKIDEIRNSLKFTEHNSMLCPSETPGHYHLLFHPVYKDKPCTLSLLGQVFKPIAKRYGIEIYPMANKPVRLPFWDGQGCIDDDRLHLTRWDEMFYEFQKLDEFDLVNINNHVWQNQEEFARYMDRPRLIKPHTDEVFDISSSDSSEAYHLWKNGLQKPSSRSESQFKIIKLLHRDCKPLDITIDLVWQWIQDYHNGYSNEMNSCPERVYEHICRRANSYYNFCHDKGYYPDETHNDYNGWLTKLDMLDIIRYSGGSLPKMKFLFNLIRFCNPRRERFTINVPSKLMSKWSDRRTYKKQLDYFQDQGIIKRSSGYLPGMVSKSIRLVGWNFRNPSGAILDDDGRSIDTFHETIRRVFKREEFSELLKSSTAADRRQRYDIIKSIY